MGQERAGFCQRSLRPMDGMAQAAGALDTSKCPCANGPSGYNDALDFERFWPVGWMVSDSDRRVAKVTLCSLAYAKVKSCVF